MIVDNVATRQDIEILRVEINSVRSDLTSKIEIGLLSLEHKLTLRMGAMLLASTTLTIAVLGLLK